MVLNSAYVCPKVKNLILYFEQHTREFKLMTRNMKLVERIKAPMTKDFVITDIAYSDQYLTFACVGTDSLLHFWNFKDKKIKVLKSINARSVQNRIWYLPQHHTWITAGRDFAIR